MIIYGREAVENMYFMHIKIKVITYYGYIGKSDYKCGYIGKSNTSN